MRNDDDNKLNHSEILPSRDVCQVMMQGSKTQQNER